MKHLQIFPASKIEILKNTFQVGDSVKFQVATKSPKTSLVSSALQEISIIEESTLFISIYCIANCEPTNFHELFHIKIQCEDCDDESRINIKWFIETEIISEDSRLILPPNYFEKDQTYNFKVSVEQSGKIGEAFFMPNFNFGPKSRKCSVLPENGVALTTIFEVNCEEIKNENLPLKYFVIQDEKVVAEFHENQFNMRLKEMKSKFIQIKVEDRFGGFVMINVPVTVETLNKEEVLDIFENNLTSLIQMHDLAATITLIDLLMEKLDAGEITSSLKNDILGAISNFEFPGLASIQRILEVLNKMSIKLTLDHDLRRNLSEIMNKIMENLDLIIKFSRKIHVEDVKMTTNCVLEITNKMITPFELMPPQNGVIDPSEKLDDYPDYEEFDDEIGEKIHNLNEVSNSINNFMKILSKMFSLAVNAEEPRIEAKRDDITFTFNAMDLKSNFSLVFDDESQVIFNEDFIEYFKENFGDEIKLAILVFQVSSIVCLYENKAF